MLLGFNKLHQLAEAVHHVVLDGLGCKALVDFIEELAGALDLGFLNLAQFHG